MNNEFFTQLARHMSTRNTLITELNHFVDSTTFCIEEYSLFLKAVAKGNVSNIYASVGLLIKRTNQTVQFSKLYIQDKKWSKGLELQFIVCACQVLTEFDHYYRANIPSHLVLVDKKGRNMLILLI